MESNQQVASTSSTEPAVIITTPVVSVANSGDSCMEAVNTLIDAMNTCELSDYEATDEAASTSKDSKGPQVAYKQATSEEAHENFSFNDAQLEYLEVSFSQKQYPSLYECEIMAEYLFAPNYKSIFKWFIKRRQIHRIMQRQLVIDRHHVYDL